MKASWFGRKRPAIYGSNSFEVARYLVIEAIKIEKGLLAMDLLLDEQFQQAEVLLKESSSPFHKVALGFCYLIQCSSELSKTDVRQTLKFLADTQEVSSKDAFEAQRTVLKTSSFSPGAEYELVTIKCLLMEGLLLFLSEHKSDVTTAIRKIRRASQILKGLYENIQSSPMTNSEELYQGTGLELVQSYRRCWIERMSRFVNEDELVLEARTRYPQQTIDEYIVSGVQCCLGILNLVLTSIPKSLKKALGVQDLFVAPDHENILWNTVCKFTNSHGSLSAIALGLSYESRTSISDFEIIDAQSVVRFMKARFNNENQKRHDLHEILARKRRNFTNGRIWTFLWARVVAPHDRSDSLKLLNYSQGSMSLSLWKLPIVSNMCIFEMALLHLTDLNFEGATQGALYLLDSCPWSQQFWLFFAGACELELYRLYRFNDSERAAIHTAAAVTYWGRIEKVEQRKFAARVLPFDQYAARRAAAVLRRAENIKCSIVDSVGVSPIYEILYLWNCFQYMELAKVEHCIHYLDYSTRAAESFEDRTMRVFIGAILHRMNRELDTALAELEALLPDVISPVTGALSHSPPPAPVIYKKLKVDWIGPAILLERAVLEWTRNRNTTDAYRWISLAQSWGSDYDLSTHIFMKLASAKVSLDNSI